ncbi:hypothetical protein [Sediminibacterium sp.]|uniref:hypothetical protein n=1 Tax=Sediminibacterium sp. TaxID=1917865 RepID=UPI0025D12AA3|nr:hypothetical protein [Sediminibacterium sp.]MBW0177571.1 hypothetical protein [Sediminibacterium sp.]
MDVKLNITDTRKISKKLNKTTQRIQKNAVSTLKKMKSVEQKLFQQLQKKNSQAGVGGAVIDSLYNVQLQKIQSLSDKTSGITDYFPSLDSLQTGLAFIEKTGKQLPVDQLKNLQLLSGNISGLQQQLNAANQLQTFLAERKNQLRQYVANSSLAKEWKRVNKEVYYYQQQLGVYKELLKHPDKAVEKLIDVLREQPAFRQFMANNSQLAQLFRLPGQSTNSSAAGAVTGLQTRAGVSQLLQQQFPGQGITDPTAYFQQQIGAAQAEMNQWKEKLNQLGGGSSDLVMPDFKPNQQKTKTFLQRIEWGLNIQSQRPNGLFPVTSELALMAGYKLNDKSTVGLGAAYKMGWGKNFSTIKITHQGVGLRSFLDIKLKGSFWITGGYELNHQQEFNRLDELKDLNAWQRSGLIGLSKKYSIGKKKGNLQLLWDFLSYGQVPRTQALKFRVGYNF